MNWKEQIKERSFLVNQERVVYHHDMIRLTKQTIQELLEQIEDCKFSQLGDLIEKLKEEYK